MFMISNPPTGDAGLNPIVLVLFIVCAIIIVGCLVWAFFLNRKNSNVETTVITVTDEDLTEIEPNIVEEIDNPEE
ncbi:MAG: hypothetical protein E7551_00465 [Ruminococcaceae bacterium]|nr:hypothetical protein [Oscillospiraceae bacterium]